MMLRLLPRVFTWDEASPELTLLHQRYIELLAGRLGQLMSRLVAASSRPLVNNIDALLRQIDNGVLAETLAAPEVSFRLLWPSHHDDLDAATFILDALRSADAGARGLPVNEVTWLATGHAYLDASGTLTRPWEIPGGLPIDCGSPHAFATDVSGERVRSATRLQPIDPDTLRATLDRLDLAVTHTQRSVPHAWRMAHGFTKALILLPEDTAPQQFSSGSSGQFVGRSVFANPHLDKVTEVELAEALVHEAIHAVLYMDEQHDPWVLDPALYAGPLRITSPWTGNRLPLRPFLQASFVWYGLLAFWSRARAADLFPADRVRRRLNEAAAGFVRVNLLEQVASVVDRLSPEVLDAVDEMQRVVMLGLDMTETA